MEPARAPSPSNADRERVVEILRCNRALTERDISRARAAADASGEALHVAICRLGLVDEAAMARALAEGLGLPLFGESDFPQRPLLEGTITPAFLRKAQVLPIRVDGNALVIAMADPLDRETLRTLELFLEGEVRLGVAVPAELGRHMARLYGLRENRTDTDAVPGPMRADRADVERLADLASETPVVQVVNTLVSQAVADRASDIHLMPQAGNVSVRQRIDGILREEETLPTDLHSAVVSRIKILAKLDILERRRPQDGRFRLNVQGRVIDVRVSTLPTMHGESVAMRVLDKASIPLALDGLGLNRVVSDQLDTLLSGVNGILLVTGPTGSGKTTTLYAALGRLNDGVRNLITIEDPIEYEVAGIRQIQTDARIDLSFAMILRSVLRHDPDVILVGEIRDLETAQIAIQASLTGHVVLATLHTNSATTAVTRLTDMGVEPYLITSALRGVVAQRLVRVLCPSCREAAATRPESFRANGCEECGHSGYRGRTAISEMLVLDDAVRTSIMQRGDAAEIERVAVQQGMRDIRRDALDKVAEGITSLEEVARVTGEP